jgi:membrane protein involved in colicin uptake
MSKKPLVRNKKHRGLTKANVKLEKVIVDIENIAKKIFKGKKGGGVINEVVDIIKKAKKAVLNVNKVDPDVNKSIQDFLEKNRDKMKKLKNKLIDEIFDSLKKSIEKNISVEVDFKKKLIDIVLNINKLNNDIFDDEILFNDRRTPTISAIIILNTIIKYSNSQSIMKKINNNELDIEIDHYKDILERIKKNYQQNDMKIQEENNKLLNEELGNIIKIRKFFNDPTYKKEDKNDLFSELKEKIENFDPINSLNKKKKEFNFDKLIEDFKKLKEEKYVKYKLSRFQKINNIIINIEKYQTTDIVFPKIYTDEYDVTNDDFSTTIKTDGNTKTVKGEQAWFDYNRRAINVEQITKNVIQEKFNEFEKQFKFETKIAKMIEDYNIRLKEFSDNAIKNQEIEEYFKTKDLNNKVEQINNKINIVNYNDENQDTKLTEIIEELKKLDNTINVAKENAKKRKAKKQATEAEAKAKKEEAKAKEAEAKTKEAVEAKEAALALAAEEVKAKDEALALAAEAKEEAKAAEEAAKKVKAEAEAAKEVKTKATAEEKAAKAELQQIEAEAEAKKEAKAKAQHLLLKKNYNLDKNDSIFEKMKKKFDILNEIDKSKEALKKASTENESVKASAEKARLKALEAELVAIEAELVAIKAEETKQKEEANKKEVKEVLAKAKATEADAEAKAASASAKLAEAKAKATEADAEAKAASASAKLAEAKAAAEAAALAEKKAEKKVKAKEVAVAEAKAAAEKAAAEKAAADKEAAEKAAADKAAEKAAADKAAADKAAAEKAAAKAAKDLFSTNTKIPLKRSNSDSFIKGGKLVAKYKSTGESVYILYKKKKIKRCVYEKTKGRGKYCKIDGEYKLLSKLKIM